MGDETPCAVAVEIIPDGMEAQEIWGSTSGLVVEAAPSSAAEATWHTVERAPAPDEVRVTWIADHVLPAGGPVRIEVAMNAPVELVGADERTADALARSLSLARRRELISTAELACSALASRGVLRKLSSLTHPLT